MTGCRTIASHAVNNNAHLICKISMKNYGFVHTLRNFECQHFRILHLIQIVMKRA